MGFRELSLKLLFCCGFLLLFLTTTTTTELQARDEPKQVNKTHAPVSLGNTTNSIASSSINIKQKQAIVSYDVGNKTEFVMSNSQSSGSNSSDSSNLVAPTTNVNRYKTNNRSSKLRPPNELAAHCNYEKGAWKECQSNGK